MQSVYKIQSIFKKMIDIKMLGFFEQDAAPAKVRRTKRSVSIALFSIIVGIKPLFFDMLFYLATLLLSGIMSS